MNDIHYLRPGGDRRFDVQDLAKRWRCTPQTIRVNRHRWGLKGMKFGKRLIFSEDEVLLAEKRRARDGR